MKNAILKIKTASLLLVILCFVLSFTTYNSLGFLVKHTSIIQPPKKQGNTMYNFSDVHTGCMSTHLGILKAQKDKAVRDSIIASYKK